MPIQAMQLISQFTCLYGARLRNKRYQFVSGGPAGKYKPPKKVFGDRNSKGKGEVPTLSIFVRASWPGHLPSHRSFPPAVVIFPPRLGGPAQPLLISPPTQLLGVYVRAFSEQQEVGTSLFCVFFYSRLQSWESFWGSLVVKMSYHITGKWRISFKILGPILTG